MNTRTALPILPLLALVAGATTARADDLERLLTFEGSSAESLPAGWNGEPATTLFPDSKVVHSGKWAARIDRTPESPQEFSSVTASIPIDFAGKTIELRGFLKTEGVAVAALLWIKEDGDSGPVARDYMQGREIKGTTDWTEHTVKVPLEEAGARLSFGAILAGPGTLWIDDLQFLVDGKPIAEAPRLERKATALDTDHEFDGGSKVAIATLTPDQTANLAILGKVWGFLKYHHPRVVAGDVHWDYELFRVLPQVLAASDRMAANQALLDWAKKLGEVASCDPCASPPANLAFPADLDWMNDRATLGEPLAAYLEHVHRNRPVRDDQAYVALEPGVGNARFKREKDYPEPAYPDPGYRILALFRFWNAVQYWSPYRDVIGSDWHQVLPEFVPRFVRAKDVEAYRIELFALLTRMNDGHANLWTAIPSRPPRGDCQVPVFLRPIEGRAIVVGYTHADKGPQTKLELGDAVRALDGTPVDKLMANWAPYYSASNETLRTAEMTRWMTQGPCGPIKLTAERAGQPLEISTERIPIGGLDQEVGFTHDRPGHAFQRLSPEVAYLKLSSVRAAEIPDYLKGAEGTKGWIIDIRNYPSEFMPFALGGHFVDKPTPFVRFTFGDPSNAGAFRWTDPPLEVKPLEPRYPGKVVILIDETSISQSEYTAMAFRAAPNAIVVGSTTAGADGNVSRLPLPGGLVGPISGLGVFYPDKRPTQRVGIVPDVEVRPTIAGIKGRRDEVLEAALRQILGPETSDEQLRKLAR